MTTQIAITYGDGVGFELIEAALRVMREAYANLDVEILQMGEEQYRLGDFKGYDSRALRTIKRVGVLLKAPTIRPELIEELKEQALTPASTALYADLDLLEQKREWIWQDAPEFTAICSINDEVAVFECALEFDAANPHPAGMIFAACKMLEHIGQNDVAARIEKALLKALEGGAGAEIFAEKVVESLEF